MSNTWVIDLRHYLKPGGALAELQGRARRLAEYWTEIVAQGSNFDEPIDGGIAPVQERLTLVSIRMWRQSIGVAQRATTTGSFMDGRDRFEDNSNNPSFSQ